MACAEVTFTLSYWSALRGNLRMLFYGPFGWVMSLLGVCYAIYHWSVLSAAPSNYDLLVMAAAVFSAPLYIGLIQFLTWRHQRGPITYVFNAEGYDITTLSGRTSRSWRDIVRVTESAGFMFIFVEPTLANVVPLRVLQQAGHLAEVRKLVAERL